MLGRRYDFYRKIIRRNILQEKDISNTWGGKEEYIEEQYTERENDLIEKDTRKWKVY